MGKSAISTNGLRSTEFWLTALKVVVGSILAVGVSAGLISPDVSGEDTIDRAVSAIVAIVGLLVSGQAVKAYSIGRSNIKVTQVGVGSEEDEGEPAIGFHTVEGEEEYEDEDEEE